MSDVPATPTPETGTAATPETGSTTTTSTSTEPETGSTPNGETPTGDLGAITAALKKANAEAAASRKAAAALEARLKAIDDAQLSETERLKLQATAADDKATAAETRANERVLRSEIRLAAVAAGFADPSDAIALIDRTGVEFDDDGEPQGIADLVAALATAKPHLVKQPDPARPTGGAPSMPAAGGGKPIDITTMNREQVAALDPIVRAEAIRRAAGG